MATEISPGMSPVGLAMTTLDQLHDSMILPWWAMLSFTAVSLRFMLLPFTIKQIQSTAPTMALFSQAIKIIRMQNPGRPILENSRKIVAKFAKLRRYSEAPHYGWMFAAPLIQIPSFVIVVMAVRCMCQSHWPGFDEGGALWFRDLTQFALSFSDWTTHMSPIGAVLPIAIVLSYLTHIHISFQRTHIAGSTASSIGQIWTRLVRTGLEWLSIAVLLITLQLPQGVLVYWLTSSLCSVGQGLLLKRASVRIAFKLPRIDDRPAHEHIASFTPQVMELFLQVAEHRAEKRRSDAIRVLNEIVKMDPTISRVHFALGQLHGELQEWDLAIECYRRSISLDVNFPLLQAKSLNGIGVALFMKGDYATSEETLLTALRLDRSNVAILMALTGLYKRMGHKERAKEALQLASELDPRLRRWAKHL